MIHHGYPWLTMDFLRTVRHALKLDLLSVGHSTKLDIKKTGFGIMFVGPMPRHAF